MCQGHNLDNSECQTLLCSSTETMALVIYDMDLILYFLVVFKIKGAQMLKNKMLFSFIPMVEIWYSI